MRNAAERFSRGNAKDERGYLMHRMLVVIFKDETGAYEGRRRLLQLDTEGCIRVNGDAVLAKHADGSATVKEQEAWPRAALISTALGSLIGMLGGPIGVISGATAGFAAGGISDLNTVRISEDFVEDVGKHLSPNSVAVVAQIEEGEPTEVDNRMKAIGGTVLRSTLLQVVRTTGDDRLAAMKAELGNLREKYAKARADRKARLQKTITELESRVRAWQLEVKK